jgi:ankyrin repeat protein
MNLHAAGLRTAGYGMEVSMTDPRSPWPLPERPSLEQLRKQAKDLRDTEHHTTLTSAQLALARRYGFASWPKLKLAVELLQLREAIGQNDAKRVRDLLDESPALAGERFPDGSTPLHEAVEGNRTDLVALLATHGAPLAARFGKSAHTPLSWALTVEAFDAAKKLVELGDQPDLFCAAGLGDVDRVRAFWDDDGRVRRSPSKTGSSRTSATGEHLPGPPASDADQVSDALYIASRLGHLEVSRWLLGHGAAPNWRGYCGATSLAWAEFSGNAEVGAMVRANGGADDITDYTYQATPRAFPVMVFASWGFAHRLLTRLNADRSLADIRTGTGTPLHAAAATGKAACVRVLLGFGADRSAVDTNGRTPVEIAKAGGHADVAALLQ